MTALDALNRARLAWEATQPQLTLPGVLEQATAGNTERQRVALGAGRLLERTASTQAPPLPGAGALAQNDGGTTQPCQGK